MRAPEEAVPARFAATAGRLAGQVPALLGWTPDAFWRATPAELAAVLRAMNPVGDAPPMTRRDLETLERNEDG